MADLFVKLDVNFQDNDALLEVSAEAELLFVRGLALCKRMLNDGLITRGQCRRLGDKLDDWRKAAEELVSSGLWEEDPDGFLVCSWMKHNWTAEEVDQTRANRRRGASVGNHNRWHRDRGITDPDCDLCTDVASDSLERSPSESGSDRQSRDRVETETEKKTLPSTDVDRDEAAEQFEHFWDSYPSRNGKKIGKKNALLEWRKLTLDQRRRALVGARHLASSEQLPKDPERFLRKPKGGRGDFPFDDWQEPAKGDQATQNDEVCPLCEQLLSDHDDETCRVLQAVS